VPSGLTNIAAIAAGYEHNLAVRSNGTIVAWGANLDGQTNVPPGISNAVAIAAGKMDSLALLGDGAASSPPLRAEDPVYSNGVFGVSVQTRSGKDYRLEYKDSLEDSNWNGLASQPGDGMVMRLTAPASAPRRFFRVREL
jgi:hypothetical protein